MTAPRASRPHMPGYLAPGAGGTLPWSWATERIEASRAYWVSTVGADHAPHSSPVWGVWLDDSFWFSCDKTSMKARNITRRPAVVVTTDNPWEPVILRGDAEQITSRASVGRYLEAERLKYADRWDDEAYTIDFFLGGTYRVAPRSVIALDEEHFATSPTKWVFS